MTVEEYLVAVVEGLVLPASQMAQSAESGLRHSRRGLLGHRPTPPLSEYAVSRDGIDVGRELNPSSVLSSTAP
jgi:hypothetical protein